MTELLNGGLARELADRVAETLLAYQALAQRDRENIRALARRLGTDLLLEVPHLDQDVHDVAGLARLEPYLFGGPGTGDDDLLSGGARGGRASRSTRSPPPAP